MNSKNINRSIRALTLSLCLGVIFTHTTVYAAGVLGGPAGGPTPSNDLMRAPMGVQSVRQQLPDNLPADASMKAPIPGVVVNLQKNPGSIVASGKTDGSGNYQFSKLAPGDYEICISGQPCKPVKVGPDRTLRGQIPGTWGTRNHSD